MKKKQKTGIKKMIVSALVFKAPELTLAEVEVLKIKRKYAIIRHRGQLYEIPKDWLIEIPGRRGRMR